jgi:hypothetical protein
MNTDTIREEEYKGYTIKIYPDYDYDTSDEFTSPGNFHTFGRWNGYKLFQHEGRAHEWPEHLNDTYKILPQYISDYASYGTRSIPDEEAAIKSVEKWTDKHLLMLPVYVYEHGGVTMSTGAYSCAFDSGQAGYIYISRKEARAAGYKTDAQVYDAMRDYIKYLAALCEGSVYGYTVERDGDIVASCWGYVDTDCHYTDILADARAEADAAEAEKLREHLAMRKIQIVNRVPLLSR